MSIEMKVALWYAILATIGIIAQRIISKDSIWQTILCILMCVSGGVIIALMICTGTYHILTGDLWL